MLISEWSGRLALVIGTAAQYLMLFAAIYLLLRLLPQKRPRWVHLSGLRWRRASVSERWLQRLRLSREAESFMEREALLSGCGFDGDAAVYMVIRRAALVLLPVVLLLSCAGNYFAAGSLPPAVVIGSLTAVVMLLYFDLPWLKSIHRMRSQRITKEVYVISNQLLYFAGSNLHLHTKLSRCIPFAKVVQADLQRLLAEWYHDSEEALRRFKRRLGTDDGASFVETLDSLRLHESEEFYTLLRQRIQDYKEKLELAKESRKETTSYLLFVIAGIPILYTFQVFIYPWVREGQQLFESLGG
ncbi:hypothetical protein [Paenibacillus xylaniclasticus]|uniref:hypothetical protein n=1 Tax=Paenibacillus xylaniclasticus TaxID=588083 RepID=UPI000FDC5F6B|nr:MULTISPECIES: hypothetical protein [Paenibacillus]GFN29758.1 hypothetical protein PCURB6_00180 [Paenibacillus curdlanolyticus]